MDSLTQDVWAKVTGAASKMAQWSDWLHEYIKAHGLFKPIMIFMFVGQLVQVLGWCFALIWCHQQSRAQATAPTRVPNRGLTISPRAKAAPVTAHSKPLPATTSQPDHKTAAIPPANNSKPHPLSQTTTITYHDAPDAPSITTNDADITPSTTPEYPTPHQPLIKKCRYRTRTRPLSRFRLDADGTLSRYCKLCPDFDRVPQQPLPGEHPTPFHTRVLRGCPPGLGWDPPAGSVPLFCRAEGSDEEDGVEGDEGMKDEEMMNGEWWEQG
ncbi:Uu.00g050120.m01.CDS01 [Anthostomella pinea]|uniref:Uu.00g050120.m01.CDS01 n=1 Tax=Anthostomella pinea TaxID=933095 RepID=A0AAI8YMM8_9PEZI|nr:Uu.00g050120.m01.CDS01 [Anthostomella pinea]